MGIKPNMKLLNKKIDIEIDLFTSPYISTECSYVTQHFFKW